MINRLLDAKFANRNFMLNNYITSVDGALVRNIDFKLSFYKNENYWQSRNPMMANEAQYNLYKQ